jgi:hypothetical protein
LIGVEAIGAAQHKIAHLASKVLAEATLDAVAKPDWAAVDKEPLAASCPTRW